MNLNGREYYYIRNAQGDITGLFDVNGTQVVEYSYDSWGKLITTTGSLASTVRAKNPYRYRGYRYDTETGLYYLQSRYYNPEFCRMLNADSYGGREGELLSHNVFIYCLNNPINMVDPNGTFGFAIPFVSQAIIGALSIVAAVLSTPVVAVGALVLASGLLIYSVYEYYKNTEVSINENNADSLESDDEGESRGKIELPKNPDELLENGWGDVTPEGMKENTKSKEYSNPKTGEKVRFDPKKEGANGFEGKDHYHRYNPNKTGKKDFYLDVNGNAVPKGSRSSHILP